MNYRLIVIENSLKDKNILDKYTILSETVFGENTPRESKMLKIEIPEQDIELISHKITDSLIYPYYSHLYHEDPENHRLVILFSKKRFDENKKSYPQAMSYGLTHGVAKEEMAIEPADIAEEKW